MQVHPILMVLSATVILLLGVVHLAYTFWGNKLKPRDSALQDAMNQSHPGISKGTTMWRAWVGFNASHSMGAILFGLIYGFLAIAHPQLLFNSGYLLVVGFLMLAGLFLLGKVYWFNVPFAGISIALILYILSVVNARI